MARQNEETLDPEVEQAAVDPWAAAFAALGSKEQGDAEATPDTDAADGARDVPDTQGADEGMGAAEAQPEDGTEPEGDLGGPGDLGGADGREDGHPADGDPTITPEQVAAYRESFTKDIKDRVLRDVTKAYLDRGARNVNGRLGASINDPDVCKRDRDGVPRFYNPETGREFTGDNPRRQAQEWVDDYNRELSDAFNKTCQDYEAKLMQQEGGQLAVIEFMPKYQALDEVRKFMLDSILEDYEITDSNGDVIAYSCDLDKALAAVNRQVAALQGYGRQRAQSKPPAPPTGPALDTPSTNAGQQGNDTKPKFKSLAEAMEWEQNRLLEESRNKRKGRR